MIIDIVAAVLILTGSLLAFTAAIGIVRFPDTLSRMHAATKPQTFGMILILCGAFVKLAGHPDGGMLVLTGLFALITAPVVAQRVGRLVYREQALGTEVVDEADFAVQASSPTTESTTARTSPVRSNTDRCR